MSPRSDIASVRCRHCHSETFKVFLDVRHLEAKVGDIIRDTPLNVYMIECTECGEEYVKDGQP